MKYLLLSSILCILLSNSSYARTIVPRVDENVELMSILSRLAGYPEYCMNKAGEYDTDIARYFNEYADHPAVTFMKEIRNTDGISYDAPMSMAIHLQKSDDDRFTLAETEENALTRWNHVDKTEFLSLLTQFYADTRFHRFFTTHDSIYRRSIAIYEENVLKNFDENWYSDFYGTAPEESYRIIIAFCNGGANYGPSRHLKGQKKEVFAILGHGLTEESAPWWNESNLPTLIHEFNHSFINHLLPANDPVLEKAWELLYRTTEFSMQRQAYGTWETVLNESLVRAATLCYLLDKFEDESTARKELEIELQRNFHWMPELVQLFRKYQKQSSRYGTFEKFYPEITDFFDKYAQKQEKRIRKSIES